MDLGALVVADEGSFELVEPGEGALDDPAVPSEAGAVVGLTPCDLGLDPALAAPCGGFASWPAVMGSPSASTAMR